MLPHVRAAGAASMHALRLRQLSWRLGPSFCPRSPHGPPAHWTWHSRSTDALGSPHQAPQLPAAAYVYVVWLHSPVTVTVPYEHAQKLQVIWLEELMPVQ